MGELLCVNHQFDAESESAYFVDLLCDIGKARLFHSRFPRRCRGHILTEFLGRTVHQLDGFQHTGGLEVCPVVGVCVDIERGDFKPASGSEVFQSLLKDMVVVPDGALEFTAVDIVKLLAVGPGLLEIVDFKTAIRRNPDGLIDVDSARAWVSPRRLDWTQVVSCRCQHLYQQRVMLTYRPLRLLDVHYTISSYQVPVLMDLLCKINSPDTGPCADIQHAARFIDRSAIQSAPEKHSVDMMALRNQSDAHLYRHRRHAPNPAGPVPVHRWAAGTPLHDTNDTCDRSISLRPAPDYPSDKSYLISGSSATDHGEMETLAYVYFMALDVMEVV